MATEELESFKKQLIDTNRKTQEELDKSLITLSTTLLGLSFILRQQIYSQTKHILYERLLFIESIAFLLSILCVLASYLLSMHYTQKSINLIDLDSSESVDDNLDFIYNTSKITAKFNSSAAFFFVLGLILLFTFAFLNFT